MKSLESVGFSSGTVSDIVLNTLLVGLCLAENQSRNNHGRPDETGKPAKGVVRL